MQSKKTIIEFKNIVKKFGEANIKIDSFKFTVDSKNNSLVKLIIESVEQYLENFIFSTFQ